MKAEILAAVASLTAAANALPDDPGAPTPPTSDPLVVLLQSQHFHQQGPSTFKFDLAPQSKLAPRGVPLDARLLSDAINGIVAPPLNGAAVTSEHVLPLLGAPTTLYSQVPYFRPLTPGDPYAGLSDPFNPEMGDDFANIVADLNARPMPGGERGRAMASAYCSILPHPNKFDASTTTDSSKWGSFIPRAPTASVVDHAGNMWLLYVRAAVNGKNKVEYLSAGKMPAVSFVHAVCSDRTDRKVLYGCDLGSKSVQGVWSGGRVFKAYRNDASRGSATQGEDASKYTVTDELTGLGYPSSVESDDAGNLYAIDGANGNLWRKLKGAAWVLWQTVPNAFALDCANGVITLVGRDLSVRQIDANGALGPNQMPAQYVTAPFGLGIDFATVSVDRNGSCGPVGGVRVARVHTVGNTNLWQFTPGLAAVKYGQQIFLPSMQGWLDLGVLAADHEPYGHYDWLGGKYHPWQGISFHGGYGNVSFTVIAHNASWIPAPSTLPTTNYTAFWRGKRVMTEQGLTTMVSREGWSPFAGCSFDEMAELAKTQGFDALRVFLQGGMISITPRPGIGGLDLVCLMALIIADSACGLAEGKPFMDAFLSWAAQFGALPNPAATVQSSYVAEAAKYLEARQVTPRHYRIGVFAVGGSTPVRYTSLHEDHATAIPSDAVIVADEGTPFEALLANGDGAALTVGQHALTVRSASMPTRAIAVRAA